MRMIKMSGLAEIEAPLIAGGLLFYALIAPQLRFDIGDEGYVLYIAQQILDGQRLYTDIELFTYLPGLFYLFAGLLHFAKGEITTLNLLLALPLTLNAWLTFRIVKNHAGLLMGLIAAVALMLYPGPWNRFYIPTLNLAILFCVSQFLLTSQTKWLGWLGAIAGIGLAIRIDASACGLVMLAACVMVSPLLTPPVPKYRLLHTAILGFLLALAVILILIASAGILGDFLSQVYGLGAQITERSTADIKMAPPSLSDLLNQNVFAWQFYLSLLIPASLAGLLAWFWHRQEKECCFWLLLLVWVGFNLPQYLIERPDMTHLSHRFFSLSIATLIAIQRLLGLAKAGSKTFRCIAISCVLALVCPISFIFVSLCKNTNYSFLIWLSNPPTACLSNGRCFHYSSNSMAHVIPLLDNISKDKMPGDTVAVLPFAPGLAFLLKMPMPGNQNYLLPISLSHPNAERHYVQDLLASKTRYVLLDLEFKYSQSPLSGLDVYAPYLYQTLRECFVIAEQQKNWQLLRRNEKDCTPIPTR